MSAEGDPDEVIASVLRDLDVVRKRLDQAQEWLQDGQTSISAAAIAETTRQLCQQASICDDSTLLRQLLEQARDCLRDLEKLLGLH